jgi:hypothetical protein
LADVVLAGVKLFAGVGRCDGRIFEAGTLNGSDDLRQWRVRAGGSEATQLALGDSAAAARPPCRSRVGCRCGERSQRVVVDLGVDETGDGASSGGQLGAAERCATPLGRESPASGLSGRVTCVESGAKGSSRVVDVDQVCGLELATARRWARRLRRSRRRIRLA